MTDLTDRLIDPQDKYHAEGFAEQPQDWPGLQRDMSPVPIAVRPAITALAG